MPFFCCSCRTSSLIRITLLSLLLKLDKGVNCGMAWVRSISSHVNAPPSTTSSSHSFLGTGESNLENLRPRQKLLVFVQNVVRSVVSRSNLGLNLAQFPDEKRFLIAVSSIFLEAIVPVTMNSDQ